MAAKKKPGKSVRSIKGEEQKPQGAPGEHTIQINPGNIPVLQTQILDAINKNLVVIIKQNAKIIERLDKNG